MIVEKLSSSVVSVVEQGHMDCIECLVVLGGHVGYVRISNSCCYSILLLSFPSSLLCSRTLRLPRGSMRPPCVCSVGWLVLLIEEYGFSHVRWIVLASGLES